MVGQGVHCAASGRAPRGGDLTRTPLPQPSTHSEGTSVWKKERLRPLA